VKRFLAGKHGEQKPGVIGGKALESAGRTMATGAHCRAAQATNGSSVSTAFLPEISWKRAKLRAGES